MFYQKCVNLLEEYFSFRLIDLNEFKTSFFKELLNVHPLDLKNPEVELEINILKEIFNYDLKENDFNPLLKDKNTTLFKQSF